MTAPDRELNVELLVTTLHEIQVSVAMLIEQLARDRPLAGIRRECGAESRLWIRLWISIARVPRLA